MPVPWDQYGGTCSRKSTDLISLDGSEREGRHYSLMTQLEGISNIYKIDSFLRGQLHQTVIFYPGSWGCYVGLVWPSIRKVFYSHMRNRKRKKRMIKLESWWDAISTLSMNWNFYLSFASSFAVMVGFFSSQDSRDMGKMKRRNSVEEFCSHVATPILYYGCGWLDCGGLRMIPGLLG